MNMRLTFRGASSSDSSASLFALSGSGRVGMWRSCGEPRASLGELSQDMVCSPASFSSIPGRLSGFRISSRSSQRGASGGAAARMRLRSVRAGVSRACLCTRAAQFAKRCVAVREHYSGVRVSLTMILGVLSASQHSIIAWRQWFSAQ